MNYEQSPASITCGPCVASPTSCGPYDIRDPTRSNHPIPPNIWSRLRDYGVRAWSAAFERPVEVQAHEGTPPETHRPQPHVPLLTPQGFSPSPAPPKRRFPHALQRCFASRLWERSIYSASKSLRHRRHLTAPYHLPHFALPEPSGFMSQRAN